MAQHFQLSEIAARFFEKDSRFKTTLFQAYSCASDLQYLSDHFFKKVDSDPTVDSSHPFWFAIANFEKLDLQIAHEFQYVDTESKKFVFFSKIDQIPAPKCAMIIFASPIIYSGEQTFSGPAQAVFAIYKSLLLGMFGRGFLLDLIAEFSVEGAGQHATSFSSSIWRTPQVLDTRAIVDPSIYNDLINRMRIESDPLRARLVLACQFFSRANEERHEYKRFFDYWTAFEIAANGKAQKVRSIVAKAYGKKLPYVDRDLRFNDISTLRHDLIHKGLFGHLEPEVERRMQAIFVDILRYELGLPCMRITARLGV